MLGDWQCDWTLELSPDAPAATVTATNYPAQTARARTAILIDDSIKVDIALVVDTTGSMQGEIDGIKAAFILSDKGIGLFAGPRSGRLMAFGVRNLFRPVRNEFRTPCWSPEFIPPGTE